jgi:uncharacterized protein YjbI with pentapeptide repeats
MTVRDWLDLLVVPLALVVIGLVFTMLQDARQQEIENQRQQQAQKIENQRAEAERKLAEQRADDEALQAYLNQMSTLLLEKDLRSSTEVNATEESQEARANARARTLTVLSRLDPSGKTALMQFLMEADLVQRVDRRRDPIIGLSRADLSGANLDGATLHDADLREADLSNAHLSNYADLHDADLYRANLGGANLSNAYLRRANLEVANLRDANLSGAFLRDANLSNAVRWTEKQLTAAAGLAGTTMPNGQKHEDWLKDKEGSGKDVENE